MRQLMVTVCLALLTVAPAQAIEFLGVDLCKGSVDTSVVLPVGSPLSLESAEVGRHGGLLMLLKADNGDVMDHIDNLMAFYTDSRGTGDAKKLQWTGNGITAYAQIIKKGFAALAVSTDDNCRGADTATIMGGERATEKVASEAPLAVVEETGVLSSQPELKPKNETGAIVAESSVSSSQQELAQGDEAGAVVAEGSVLSSPQELERGDDTGTVAEISAPEPEAVPPPVPVPVPAPVEDFVLSGKLKHSPAEDMWVDVMGVVVNNSGASYHIANFDLSFYDAAGDLICVDAISVSELRDGQKRAFRDSIRCSDYTADTVTTWKLQFAGGN